MLLSEKVDLDRDWDLFRNFKYHKKFNFIVYFVIKVALYKPSFYGALILRLSD